MVHQGFSDIAGRDESRPLNAEVVPGGPVDDARETIETRVPFRASAARAVAMGAISGQVGADAFIQRLDFVIDRTGLGEAFDFLLIRRIGKHPPVAPVPQLSCIELVGLRTQHEAGIRRMAQIAKAARGISPGLLAGACPPHP